MAELKPLVLKNGGIEQLSVSDTIPYVLKAGDTMTGALVINPSSGTPTLSLRSTTDDTTNDILALNVGNSGLCIWYSNPDSGDNAFVFDTAYQAFSPVNIEVNDLYAYNNIDSVSASITTGNITNVNMKAGNFTILITNNS